MTHPAQNPDIIPNLTPGSHRPTPSLHVWGDMHLKAARAHEFCGNARRRLAVMAAAQTTGPVIWISPAWQAEALNPDGLQPLMDPGRLLLVRASRAEDLLWSLEEALRSGAVALVVGDLPQPPGMTPVRRLHLAAEAGAELGASAGITPIGLLLTPGEGGAPGIESRWSLDTAHEPEAQSWTLIRRRARTKPPASWQISMRDLAAAHATQSRDMVHNLYV
ncbi:MAG: ImuA family protein [Mangrovicoccus sp.]